MSDLSESLEDYIEAIAELIAVNGHDHTKEIAEKLGFTNEYYFSRFFRKHLGVPPLTYRKNRQF